MVEAAVGVAPGAGGPLAVTIEGAEHLLLPVVIQHPRDQLLQGPRRGVGRALPGTARLAGHAGAWRPLGSALASLGTRADIAQYYCYCYCYCYRYCYWVLL